MIRTLITGAAGFTGAYLAPLLASRGHEVHGLFHGDEPKDISGLDRLYACDITDRGAVQSVVDEIQPQHVVHLAAIAYVEHQDVEQMYLANVCGTRNLLDALAGLVQTPRSVIIASSANVYGNSKRGILREDDPFAQANDYAVTKVATEFVASIYSARLPLIIVRPFNYTGRGQSFDFVVPKIVRNARERNPELELGNIDVARDFSDVRTVVDAYARLLEAPEAIGETFNVSSGSAISLKELLSLVGRLSGHHPAVAVNSNLVRKNDVRSLCGCSDKLREIIGPLKQIPIEETLRWMLED